MVSKQQGPGKDLEAGNSGQEREPLSTVLKRHVWRMGTGRGPLKSTAVSHPEHHCHSL